MRRQRVAVIGGGFGGLTAAAELAHQGHAVTLFEQGPTLGGKAQVVTRDGLTFDTGPTLLTLPEVVSSTFARIGASALLPRFHRLSLHARYSWTDGRVFEAHDDLEATLASAQVFGAREAAGLRAFFLEAERIYEAAGEAYLAAPFTGFAEFAGRVMRQKGALALVRGVQLSTLSALATRFFGSRHLQQFVGRFATYTGASPYDASAAFALIPHLERVQGVHHVEGGMGALVHAFAAALKGLGVEVRLGVRARWERREQHLLVGALGEEEPFDGLVVNADPLTERTPTGSAPQKLAMSGYVALLDVKRRLPLAHHHVVFSDDYRREFAEIFSGHVPSEPTLYFCHAAATDPTVAPPERSGLFAMVNAPAFTSPEQAARWTDWGPRLRERCVTTLLQLVPGLARSEVEVVAERTPLDLAAQGAPGGSIYGFLPHGRLGAFQRPPMASPVPGVFYAGGSTHPGGGVPMVIRSGHFAATALSRHLDPSLVRSA